MRWWLGAGLMTVGGLLVFHGGLRIYAMTEVALDDPGAMLWLMLIGLALFIGGALLKRSYWRRRRGQYS